MESETMVEAEFDIHKFKASMNFKAKRSMPAAMKNALNNTAFKVQEWEKRQTKEDIDRPTPFTLRGYRIKKATASKSIAVVYISPMQAEYMKKQITLY